ncbi:hypothetical protein [Ramlibacter sp. Leaf400]|nr:hypothetical protein [Ramlibacter sp. Leaf400]
MHQPPRPSSPSPEPGVVHALIVGVVAIVTVTTAFIVMAAGGVAS